jgi:hypothetical protein
MAQKYFYVVNHYVPFPSSEYGGIWIVIAEDNEECFDLITENEGDYPEYYNKLRENIIKATKFKLTDDPESKIVESFLT